MKKFFLINLLSAGAMCGRPYSNHRAARSAGVKKTTELCSLLIYSVKRFVICSEWQWPVTEHVWTAAENFFGQWWKVENCHAPLWRSCSSSTICKCPDLLTYLLTFLLSHNRCLRDSSCQQLSLRGSHV